MKKTKKRHQAMPKTAQASTLKRVVLIAAFFLAALAPAGVQAAISLDLGSSAPSQGYTEHGTQSYTFVLGAITPHQILDQTTIGFKFFTRPEPGLASREAIVNVTLQAADNPNPTGPALEETGVLVSLSEGRGERGLDARQINVEAIRRNGTPWIAIRLRAGGFGGDAPFDWLQGGTFTITRHSNGDAQISVNGTPALRLLRNDLPPTLLQAASFSFGAFSEQVTARALFAEIREMTTAAPALVCALKVDEAGVLGPRVATSLHLKTHNADPDLSATWNSLFGVAPGTSAWNDDIITLQTPDRTVTWEAGTLVMGGVMNLKVTTDNNNPALKHVKIEKTGKFGVPTLFVSGTGGVNPNIANGGWHKVKIKNLDGVTLTFGTSTITGFLKELEVVLDKDSTTGAPVVKDFKLKFKGATTVADVKKGTLTSVTIEVPATAVTAKAGTEYEEKIEEDPIVLTGHTGAEFERADGALSEGVNIASLTDGNNDALKQREGACRVQ